MKENGGEGEFKYYIFDILQELLQQHNPTQHSNKNTRKKMYF
jgi:hypothetical protein